MAKKNSSPELTAEFKKTLEQTKVINIEVTDAIRNRCDRRDGSKASRGIC